MNAVETEKYYIPCAPSLPRRREGYLGSVLGTPLLAVIVAVFGRFGVFRRPGTEGSVCTPSA